MKELVFDVKGKSLGRAASEIAVFLRGKMDPGFQPNRVPSLRLKIVNISKIKISGNKMEQKTYKRHSGYPGGLKTASLKKEFKKSPEKVLRKAVWNMLAKNKLRQQLIKNLKFE
jgi:large subunit ribosomal protein L13